MKALKNIENWAISNLEPNKRNELLLMLGDVLDEQTEMLKELIIN